MKNILLIEGGISISGGQIMSRKIGECLLQKYNVGICIPNNCEEIKNYYSDFKEYFYNIKDYNLGKKHIDDYLKFFWNSIGITKRIMKVVKKNEIEVIYVQSQKMIPYAVVVGKLLNKPVIIHLHVFHVDKRVRKLLNYFANFKCVKNIIGVSEYTLSQLNSANKKKSNIIYNMIGDEKTKIVNKFDVSKINIDKKNISIVADVIKEKGQEILIEAVNMIDDEEINLYIVGSLRDKVFYDSLKNKIKKLKPNTEVIFTKRIDNVMEFLKYMDLNVIPSTVEFETFSLAMVEAWKCGTMTLASDFGGMKELVDKFIKEDREIVLFKKNDALELSMKIKKILSLKNEDYNEITLKMKNIVNDEFNQKKFYEKIYFNVQSVLEKDNKYD